MLQSVEIPEDIDSLPQVLMWELDEFGIVVVLFYAGLIAHELLYALGAIYLFTRYYSRFKGERLAGFHLHAPYRLGLIPLNPRFPNGGILEYLS